MKVQFEFCKDKSRFGLYLDAGNGTFIEVFEADADQNTESQSIKHLCFQVDDIDETIQTLRSNDIDISDKKMGADNRCRAGANIRMELTLNFISTRTKVCR